MRMFRKSLTKVMLSFVLAIALVIGVVPLMGFVPVAQAVTEPENGRSEPRAYKIEGDTEAEAWKNLKIALSSNGPKRSDGQEEDGVPTYFRLMSNCTAGSDDTHILVPAGRTVVLDLGGYTVNYSASGDGLWDDENNPDYWLGAIVVMNGGTLTIWDSGTNGTITGGTGENAKKALVVYGNCTFDSGTVAGAVMVGDSDNHKTGNFTMNGGKMENCTLTVDGSTTFAMNGGSISGQGVSNVVSNYGTFNMSDGKISGTNVTDSIVYASSTFTMSGGTVSGSGQYGGVYAYYPDSFHVSGAPVVSSVYLGEGCFVTIDGALTSGASIPVFASVAPTADTPVVITSGLTTKGSANAENYFTNTTTGTRMVKNADGELELRRPSTEWDELAELLSTSGTVKLTKNYTATSVDQSLTIPRFVSVVLDLNGHTVDGSALHEQKVFDLNQGGYHPFPYHDATTLTITDSASGGRIVCGTNLLADVYNDCELIIAGGTIESSGSNVVSTTGRSHSRFTMTGGAITASCSGGGSVVHLQSDYFTMTGGTISGTGYDSVIYHDGYESNSSLISGGTITGTNVTNVVLLQKYSNLTVSGGTIDGSQATNAVIVDPTANASTVSFTVSGSPAINGVMDLTGYPELGSGHLLFAGNTTLTGVKFSTGVTAKIKEGYAEYTLKLDGNPIDANSNGTYTIPAATEPVTITADMTTPLTHSDIAFDTSIQIYTGEELLIPVTHLGRLLTKDEDYTVTYTKDGETATKLMDVGTYTATFTGAGDYTGTKEVSIIICPAFGKADLVLPVNCRSIEPNAFEGDTSIITVDVNKCTSIGDEAFLNCTNLSQIRIPAGCSIGKDAFKGCTHLYVYGRKNSTAERYCTEEGHENCIFVEEK